MMEIFRGRRRLGTVLKQQLFQQGRHFECFNPTLVTMPTRAPDLTACYRKFFIPQFVLYGVIRSEQTLVVSIRLCVSHSERYY